LTVGRDVTGTVTSQGPITSLAVPRDLTGTVSAAGDIGSVTVGRTLSGTLVSGSGAGTGGDIGSVTVGGVFDPAPGPGEHPAPAWSGTIDGADIHAWGGDIGTVEVVATAGLRGDEAGVITNAAKIRADDGKTGEVYAGGSIDARITAGEQIGFVHAGRAGEGAVTGKIESAPSSIGFIFASGGSIDADVDAANGAVGDRQTTIDHTGYGEAALDALVDELGAANGLFAGQDVAGTIDGRSVGDVLAGAGISAEITTTQGDIGDVTAGAAGEGSFTGTLDAAGDIGHIRIRGRGRVNRALTPARGDNPGSEHETCEPGSVTPIPVPIGDYYLAQSATGGDITGDGSVKACGSIASVTADGNITVDITAGEMLGPVWALGNLGVGQGQTTIRSGAGDVRVDGWGDLYSNVQAVGNVVVNVLGEIRAGNLESAKKALEVSTWKSMAVDRLKSHDRMRAWALGPMTVAQRIESTFGVELTGWSSIIAEHIQTNLECVVLGVHSVVLKKVASAYLDICTWDFLTVTNTAWIGGGEILHGALKEDGLLFALATKGVTLGGEGPLQVKNGAQIISGGYVTGQVVLEHGDIVISALGDSNVQLLARGVPGKEAAPGSSAKSGNIVIEAANVSNTITGKAVSINATGNLSATVQATERHIVASVHGDLTGTLTAPNGGVGVNTVSGNMTGVVKARDAVGITVWQTLSSPLIESEEGGVAIDAYGEGAAAAVSGTIIRADVRVDVIAWKDVDATVTCTNGPVTVFSGGRISGKIDAFKSVSVDAWDDVAADVVAD
ncbi:MAG: hypothetical protein ACYS5V_13100, partial [Planctomycetota bacterium]